jgi:hypothetical protein
MGRFARSWKMTKTSFRVVGQDKELLWLPILSFIATVVAVMGIAGIGFAAGVFPQITTDGGIDPVGAAVAFLMYLALAFVQVFFHAATVAGANQRLSGGDPTVGSSLRAAWKHVGRLFVWSLIVATVNVILQALRERAGPIGQIASSIAGVAWNLATYFVVPLLIFEDRSIGQSLKNSGGLFKKTWGESVVGAYGIGLVGGVFTFLWILLGLVLTVGLGSLLGAAGFIIGIVVLVMGVVLLLVLFTVAAAVYKTALYRFASEGHAGGDFDDGALAHAYQDRRKRGTF